MGRQQAARAWRSTGAARQREHDAWRVWQRVAYDHWRRNARRGSVNARRCSDNAWRQCNAWRCIGLARCDNFLARRGFVRGRASASSSAAGGRQETGQSRRPASGDTAQHESRRDHRRPFTQAAAPRSLVVE